MRGFGLFMDVANTSGDDLSVESGGVGMMYDRCHHFFSALKMT